MNNWYISPSNDDILHYGILGMKWGVRRYQNADGSLTSAGRKRYLKDAKAYAKKYRSQSDPRTIELNKGLKESNIVDYNKINKLRNEIVDLSLENYNLASKAYNTIIDKWAKSNKLFDMANDYIQEYYNNKNKYSVFDGFSDYFYREPYEKISSEFFNDIKKLSKSNNPYVFVDKQKINELEKKFNEIDKQRRINVDNFLGDYKDVKVNKTETLSSFTNKFIEKTLIPDLVKTSNIGTALSLNKIEDNVLRDTYVLLGGADEFLIDATEKIANVVSDRKKNISYEDLKDFYYDDYKYYD